MQGNGIRPMGDRVLVERLDGDGREEVLPSGLVLPARDVTLRQGNSERIPDTFRARVLAVSAQAERVGIAEGDEVLVHTYDQRPDQTLVGEETRFGLLVRVDDILGVVEEPEEVYLDGLPVRLAGAARHRGGAAFACAQPSIVIMAKALDDGSLVDTGETHDGKKLVAPAVSRLGFT